MLNLRMRTFEECNLTHCTNLLNQGMRCTFNAQPVYSSDVHEPWLQLTVLTLHPTIQGCHRISQTVNVTSA